MDQLALRIVLYFSAAIAGGMLLGATVIFGAVLVYIEAAAARPTWAAVLLALLSALTMAAVMFGSAVAVLRYRIPRPKASAEAQLAEALGQTFGADIVAMMQANPRASAAAAMLAGVATGISPQLRRLLRAAL